MSKRRIKNFLTDNHYKANYEPVRIKRYSYRVFYSPVNGFQDHCKRFVQAWARSDFISTLSPLPRICGYLCTMSKSAAVPSDSFWSTTQFPALLCKWIAFRSAPCSVALYKHGFSKNHWRIHSEMWLWKIFREMNLCYYLLSNQLSE